MSKQRVPRTRAGGIWTEARFITFIRTGLRKMSMRWPAKTQFLKSVRRPKEIPGRHKFEVRCAACDTWFPQTNIEVDHIVPCGKFTELNDLPGFVERLFCEPDGYQALCKECHQTKSQKARKEKADGTKSTK